MALTNNFPEGPLTRGLVQVIDFDFGFPFPEQVIYDNSNAIKRIWVDSNNRNKLPDEFFFKNKNGGKYRGKRNSKEIQRQKLLYKVEDVVRR